MLGLRFSSSVGGLSASPKVDTNGGGDSGDSGDISLSLYTGHSGKLSRGSANRLGIGTRTKGSARGTRNRGEVGSGH